MRREQIVAEVLADALLAVDPEIAAFVERAAWTLGRKHRWITRVPMRIARQGVPLWLAAKKMGAPHLPQGAPTSPALANLCALHLDYRLDGLARSLGGRYTRYANDIALSGGEDMRRAAARLPVLIGAIALEEGFEANHRKTRIMHESDRQSLTGIVVNRTTNPRRAEFDRAHRACRVAESHAGGAASAHFRRDRVGGVAARRGTGTA